VSAAVTASDDPWDFAGFHETPAFMHSDPEDLTAFLVASGIFALTEELDSVEIDFSLDLPNTHPSAFSGQIVPSAFVPISRPLADSPELSRTNSRFASAAFSRSAEFAWSATPAHSRRGRASDPPESLYRWQSLVVGPSFRVFHSLVPPRSLRAPPSARPFVESML
jgi:hypothetical protein